MAKILVKSPITSNGRDVVLNAQGQIRYKETVVEANARPIFEKMNRKKPQALKFIIEDYTEGSGTVTAPADIEQAKEQVATKKRANAKA